MEAAAWFARQFDERIPGGWLWPQMAGAVMGTNYYVEGEKCAHCGRGDASIHIGKSSAGWVFALNTHPALGLTSLDLWIAFLAKKVIKDEYGAVIPLGQMVEKIACRQRGGGGDLLRSMAGSGGCVSNGAGTWDYHRGDFS